MNTTPNIPGGKNLFVKNLKRLLLAVKNGDPLDEIPKLEGSESNDTLNELCLHKLSASRFVKRTNRGWELTEESKIWLDSQDDLYLAAFFSANTKFFAEILFYLDTPKTSRQLFDIAVNEYDMAWKTLSTLNCRLVWLRELNLIEFQEFSLQYRLTDLGKNFLKTVCPVMPEEIFKNFDDTLQETKIDVHENFVAYFQESHRSVRKTGLGYLPGNGNDFENTLRIFLTYVQNDGLIENIISFAQRKYGIKDSSTRSALATVSALGLIERKSNSNYGVTDLGSEWQSQGNLIDLLPLFQLKYSFFLEILTELEGNIHSAKELATIAKISYGFEKENVFEINNRLHILKRAKLIMNVSAEKLALTNRGKLFIGQYGDTLRFANPQSHTVQPSAEKAKDIISELRMASKDSFNPDKFEKIVKDYFEILGFEATWLGGSGKTDVLLKTSDCPFCKYVVTVDAKATSSSAVTDGAVDFDTLKEHQVKHGSTYVAIVGRDFNERLIRRAQEHQVALLDIDTLERLFQIHRETPLKLSSYRKIFEQVGKIDLSVLDSDVKRMKYQRAMIVNVMQRLIEESDDPVTLGRLSVRDLYMSLRNIDDLKERLSIKDIENALNFLSSPVIECVLTEKEYYYAACSLNDMNRILNFLTK